MKPKPLTVPTSVLKRAFRAGCLAGSEVYYGGPEFSDKPPPYSKSQHAGMQAAAAVIVEYVLGKVKP